MNRKEEIAQAESILEQHLSRLGPGDLAMDCGANRGAVTRRLAETGADVIAFEPDPMIFSLLQEEFGALPNVELHAAAVGIEPGEAVLYRSPYYAEDPLSESEKNTICPEAMTRDRTGGWRNMDSDTSVRVPVVDLIALLTQETRTRGRVALVKLDIEGMEIPILTEMERRGLFEKIGLTIAELHPWRFPSQSDEIEALRCHISATYDPMHVNLGWR